jgi:hypothetical protein
MGFCPECDQIERGKETLSPFPKTLILFSSARVKERVKWGMFFLSTTFKVAGLAQGSCISVAACKDDSHTRQALTSRTKQKSLQTISPGRCVLFLGFKYVQLSSPLTL